MTLFTNRMVTPLQTVTRIFGTVIVALVLILGVSQLVRPATVPGPRIALGAYTSTLDFARQTLAVGWGYPQRASQAGGPGPRRSDASSVSAPL